MIKSVPSFGDSHLTASGCCTHLCFNILNLFGCELGGAGGRSKGFSIGVSEQISYSATYIYYLRARWVYANELA